MSDYYLWGTRLDVSNSVILCSHISSLWSSFYEWENRDQWVSWLHCIAGWVAEIDTNTGVFKF